MKLKHKKWFLTLALYDLEGIEAFEIITSNSVNLKHGDLHPFILDPITTTIVAHGADSDRIGMVSVSLTNSDRPYEQILKDLEINAGTWSEYLFVNPDIKKEQLKKSWLYLHDGYIFGSGYYLP